MLEGSEVVQTPRDCRHASVAEEVDAKGQGGEACGVGEALRECCSALGPEWIIPEIESSENPEVRQRLIDKELGPTVSKAAEASRFKLAAELQRRGALPSAAAAAGCLEQRHNVLGVSDQICVEEDVALKAAEEVARRLLDDCLPCAELDAGCARGQLPPELPAHLHSDPYAIAGPNAYAEVV
jgi:hypothetical protein